MNPRSVLGVSLVLQRASKAGSFALACLVMVIPLTVQAQQAKPKATVGAYYFDGWSGKTKST